MKSSPLSVFLKSINPQIDDKTLDIYTSKWSEQRFAKKQFITKEGTTQKNLYFVLEGIQKSYFLNDGKAHIIAFTYPYSFSGIPESFLTQTPSKYFLQSITDSRVLKISYEQHTHFLKAHRQIESLFRIATEKVLFGVLERHYELMAYTIEQRFRILMKRSPHLLNQVPHKDLASYLNIDRSNFSKLLNNTKILV